MEDFRDVTAWRYWRHACKHVWRHVWRCHVWKRHVTNKKMFQVSKVGLKMSRDGGSIMWRLQADFKHLKHFLVCYEMFPNVTSNVFTRVSSCRNITYTFRSSILFRTTTIKTFKNSCSSAHWKTNPLNNWNEKASWKAAKTNSVMKVFSDEFGSYRKGCLQVRKSNFAQIWRFLKHVFQLVVHRYNIILKRKILSFKQKLFFR